MVHESSGLSRGPQRYTQFLFNRPKNLAVPNFSWENSTKMFLGVFWVAESDSELRMPKLWAVAEKLKLSGLIVHSCKAYDTLRQLPNIYQAKPSGEYPGS
jgi:hypothetical protein